MLTAVEGYYDGNQIILDENLPLANGQKVILTVFGNDATTTVPNVSAYKIKQDTTKEDAWQSFMEGINSFTEDFMPNGHEAEIPSVRETIWAFRCFIWVSKPSSRPNYSNLLNYPQGW